MKNIFKKINLISKRVNRKKALIIVVSVLFLFDIIFCINNLQNKIPILGLRFNGENISFVSQRSLQKLVRNEQEKQRNTLAFSYNQKIYAVSQNDVGYKINPAYTANSLLLVGRRGSVIEKFIVQLGALVGLENIPLSGTIAKASLTLKILETGDEINQKSVPIHPDFTHDIAKTLPAQPGIQLDGVKFASLIIGNINHPQSASIPLPVKTIQPNFHSESELTVIRQQAQLLTQTPISITSAGQFFTLLPNDLKSLLIIVERPDPQNPKKTKLVLRLDDIKLSQKLDTFAARIEGITHAEFNYEDTLAIIYGQFYLNKRTLAVIPTGSISINPKVLGAQTTNQKIAYLTFDDGPNTIYHPLILDILKQYNVKATFFLIGQNVPLARDAAVRTYAEGHLVGNHTLTHSFLPNYSSLFIRNEMMATDNILKSINGNSPVKFFRPPFGGINPTIIADAHSLGLQTFLWDVDPRDWAEPPTDVLVQRVVSYIHNGSNVLLHSNHLSTIRALPLILQTLISQGYSFHTLDTYPLPEEL